MRLLGGRELDSHDSRRPVNASNARAERHLSMRFADDSLMKGRRGLGRARNRRARRIGPTRILNSTIAFNVGAASIGAVRISYGTLDLESTIVAADTSGGAAQNIGTGAQGVVAGANNLIGPSPEVSLPPTRSSVIRRCSRFTQR